MNAERGPGVVRALLVTRNFPPLVGGMERLNRHILAALARRGPVVLVGPQGSDAHATFAASVLEVPLRPLALFLVRAMVATIGAVLRPAPNIVVAGSGLTAPHAWVAARLSGARYAVYVHGLDLVVDDAIYQRIWLPIIRRADRIVANSRHTAQLAIARGVPSDRVRVISPGTDCSIGENVDAVQVRARYGLGDGPILLSVGRLTPRKGLVPFVDEVLPVVVARYPDVRLVIVGDDASDALRGGAGSERERILEAASSGGLASHVRLVGRLTDAELAAIYSCANLHVFPVVDLPGDIEGFGMVALEAAARGVPTVGYAVGGIPDAVESGVSGELVEAGDAAALARVIFSWLDVTRPGSAAACRAFAMRNSWEAFEGRLLEALE